jgi:hypothetical protein
MKFAGSLSIEAWERDRGEPGEERDDAGSGGQLGRFKED